MRALGARDAVNLDGGGSTTMTVGGAVVTRPSDATGERPIGDAICSCRHADASAALVARPQPTAGAPATLRVRAGSDLDSMPAASTRIAEAHRHASRPIHWYSRPERTVPARRPPALAM